MPETKEVTSFFIIALLAFSIIIVFVIWIVIVFRNRQNELILKNIIEKERHKYQLLQTEIESNRKLEKERERISLDIHDDLGASLSAIKLKAEFIQNQSDNQEIKNTLIEIVDNTKEISYNMREMMWSLSRENDSVENFIVFTKNFVVQFFDFSKIKSQINTPILHENKEMNGYMRRNLFLIIKEACHNILKHSQASEMDFKIEFINEILSITILDNGKGMDPNQKKGNGLYSMNKRIESINGELSLCSNPQGTLIILTVKL